MNLCRATIEGDINGQNVEQTSERNLAFYYLEKNIDLANSTTYSNCSVDTLTLTKERIPTENEIQKCINQKYEALVEKNSTICKTGIAPELIQTQLKDSMRDLESLLIQTLSRKGSCAPKSKEAFRMAMSTFVKVKSLSVVGPWGAVAGFGADLVSTLLDKVFPSESEKASALLDDILSEDNYEQNACLYFNVQQKLYCSNESISYINKNNTCSSITEDPKLDDFLKIIGKLKKSISPSLAQLTTSTPQFDPIAAAYEGGQSKPPPFPPTINKIEDSSAQLEDNLDNLINSSKANHDTLYTNLGKLGKIQQAKEKQKLDLYFSLVDQYEKLDPNAAGASESISVILKGINELLTASDASKRVDFESLIFKNVPKEKVDALNQKGLALTIENIISKEEIANKQDPAEASRSMAKYNKYKNAVGSIAQRQFSNRLSKQFAEFKEQALKISKLEKGTITDVVTQGILRNVIRHCTLLQEIYAPRLEGNIPDECKKLNCDNQLSWFTPKKDEFNFTNFKKNYCEKAVTHKNIEEKMIANLTSPDGGTICGKAIKDFF